MSNRKLPIFFFYILFFVTAFSINQGNNTVSAISFVLILLIVVIYHEENGTVLLFCLFPMQRMFMLSRSFMTVVPLISILIILKCFLHHKVRCNCIKQLMATILLLFYSLSVEIIRFSSIKNTVEYILTIILMIVVCEIVDKNLRKVCMLVYCVSSILSALIGYFFPTVSRYTALFIMEYNPRFQGLLTDPGSFGQTMVCAMAMAITVYFLVEQSRELPNLNKVQNRFSAVNVIISCAFYLYFAILSGTRACLIALTVIYVEVFIMLIKTKRRSTQIAALLIGIVSIFALSSIGTMIFNVVSMEHGGESLSEDTRLGIWRGYIHNILNSPDVMLFGVGMNSCSMYGEMMALGNPHNIIIEKVVECGIIGFVLNLCIFIPTLRRKKMSFMTPETLPFYVWISTLLVYGTSGIILPYLLLALITEKREDNENENYKDVAHDEKPDYAIC